MALSSRFDPRAFSDAQDEIVSRGVDGLLKWLRCRWDAAGAVYFLQSFPASGSDSFAVYKNGTFANFSSRGKGERGDMIDLIGLVDRLDKPMERLARAYEYLGWGEVKARKPKTQAEIAQEAEAARARKAEEAAARAKKEKQCRAQYLQLAPAVGTLVQTYLEGRGVRFDLLGTFPGVLRFEPEARFYYGKDDFDVHPAMVAAFYRGGEIVGLHRTYLRGDGRGKAALRPLNSGKARSAKKIFGTHKGCVIPLHKGAGRLTFAAASERLRKAHEALAQGQVARGEAMMRSALCTLAVAEGIENGLVAAMVQPGYRVWAAGNKGNMAAIDWPEIAAAAVLIRDNDGASEDDHEAAFASVLTHWQRQARGRPCHPGTVPVGIKDINDWLNA